MAAAVEAVAVGVVPWSSRAEEAGVAVVAAERVATAAGAVSPAARPLAYSWIAAKRS